VVRLVGEGKGKDEVVKAVFAAPAPKPAAPTAKAPAVMVFPVGNGDAYFSGPEDASVTLVTWLDYQ